MGLSRSGWISVLLPTIGPIVSGAGDRKNLSFDDVEKMLQLFGIVSALLLSVVADAATYDYEFPRNRTMQGRAYTAFGICLVSLTHVILTYINLVATVDQGEKNEAEQMNKWARFGKLNLILQVVFQIWALIEYICYVQVTQYDGYEPDNEWLTGRIVNLYGVDNNFGLFLNLRIEFALISVLVVVHLFALPVMIHNDTRDHSESEVGRPAIRRLRSGKHKTDNLSLKIGEAILSQCGEGDISKTNLDDLLQILERSGIMQQQRPEKEGCEASPSIKEELA